jgi:putative CocE/NonD family hydrolase
MLPVWIGVWFLVSSGEKMKGLLVAVLVLVGSAAAQTPEYVKSEAMIPMRDGVQLHAVMLRPVGSDAPGAAALPFLMQRTPYGVDGTTPRSVNGKPELAASGYIFVYEDIRGRYKSEGQFVMNRPIVTHTSKADVDETTDTRDTIDWLLKNVPNNSGKVGVLGVSYPGFLAMMAGIDAHPAVKAISPQAPMTDVWMGDDFFHNGAFRETYGFDYVQQLEAQKTDVPADSKEDQYEFFLKNVDFAGAAKSAGMANLPTAKIFLTQPSYTKFWQDMAVEKRLTKSEVPTLEVGGWWDQEDMWGTQAEYEALHPHDANHQVFLVLGPWNHGGWSRGPGDKLMSDFGGVDFGGQKTGEDYRSKIEAPFFEFYLKGKAGFNLKGVASFRTGTNEWERYDVWPPKSGFAAAEMNLAPRGGIQYCPAGIKCKELGNDAVVSSYVADPADPIPYRHRPVQSTYGDGSKWRTWLVEDQRFVDGRKDLAEFKTAVLDHDVTVTGDVTADLFASTSGTDADWIVKLIDVAPNGAQTMIVDEIFRGRYRTSFEKPEPIAAGKVLEYKWSLHGADHTFLKGHRMMVEVQSSWFPLYDRNPQTYVENIMTAPAGAYQKATVKIYGGSRLEFETPMQ